MLKPGDVAPEFVLPGEDGQDISLTKMLQDSAVILYFYPADFTPGCTKEACAIRDIHDDIMAVGLKVLGISPQDQESHRRFKKEHNLPFTLVCDTEKVAIRMYDAIGPLGLGVRRITYLVSQGQKIQDAVQANLQIGQHTDFIKKAIMLRETAGMKRKAAPD
jgi:peroxiredoxin Q/BCP